MIKASARLRIPFHDVDVMNIAWHGHYLKYFELARTELMKLVNLDWPELKDNRIAMPVVEAHSHYRKAIRYDQEIEVEASITEFSFPELIIQYRILSTEGDTLSSGSTRQVYMNTEDQKTYFLVPDLVLNRLQQQILSQSENEASR
jgi:acyl-CoA thioester hydrolase